ncbi:MAG TPA: hypothetical protein VFT82_04440 [Candidatus Paceibacterota bacterium]|nr:hypothetical protein [Candidatus Paceibacterota bacterium]
MNTLLVILALAVYFAAAWALYTRQNFVKLCAPIAKIDNDLKRTGIGLLALIASAAILAFGGSVLTIIGAILSYPIIAVLLAAFVGWASYTKIEVFRLCGPVAAIQNNFVRAAASVAGFVVCLLVIVYGGALLANIGAFLLKPITALF